MVGTSRVAVRIVSAIPLCSDPYTIGQTSPFRSSPCALFASKHVLSGIAMCMSADACSFSRGGTCASTHLSVTIFHVRTTFPKDTTPCLCVYWLYIFICPMWSPSSLASECAL